MISALKVENLKKDYGKFSALKGISFEIKANEIFGLVGPNGAGKSTTLKIIATILSSTSREVYVYGDNLVKNPEQVRSVISYLPEEAGAYKNMNGMHYLKFMAALNTDDHKLQNEFINRAVEITGLGNRLKDKVKTYSKGMTRKLLLARTVMTRPKLAILDEPTSGLDVVNAVEIRKIIKTMATQGMAVLLSSHNMLEVEFLSDRVAIIDRGLIHAVGTAQELKNQYQAQNLEDVFVKITQNK